MTACRARSSGSPSSRSSSARSGQGLGSRQVAPRRAALGEHEVHRLADRGDPRRLLVGHLDAVGVLELLHERVEVERVGLQVLLEARGLLHARRVELQLVGEVGADQREDLVSRHGSGHRSGRRGRVAPRGRSAPAASSARVRAPHEVVAHAARRELDAAAMPARAEGPVRDDAEPPQAEQERAALRLGVDRVAQAAQRRAQQQPARLGARARTVAASRTAPSSAADVPSIDLERHVAGEAVGDDRRRPRPSPTAKPSTLPAKSSPGVGGQRGVGGDDVLGALAGLLAVGEQRDARARDAQHGLHEGRAHVGELDEVLGPDVDVRAAVEQQERAAGARGRAPPAPGGGRRGARLMRNSAGGQRRAGRAAGDQRVGAAVGDRLHRLDDRGVRGVARTARAGIGAPWRSRPGRRRPRRPARTADLGRGAEEQHADAAARGGERGAARDLGGPGVGPVGVDARPSSWSAAIAAAGLAAVRADASRPPESVLVVVIVGRGTCTTSRPRVEAAARAHPVRAARLVALRALVDARRGEILCCDAALARARVRLLLLGDGHGRRGRVAEPPGRRALSRSGSRAASPSAWSGSRSCACSGLLVEVRAALRAQARAVGAAGDLGRQRERERVARPGGEVELAVAVDVRGGRAPLPPPGWWTSRASTAKLRRGGLQAAHARARRARPRSAAAARSRCRSCARRRGAPGRASGVDARRAGRRRRTARRATWRSSRRPSPERQPEAREIEDVRALGHASSVVRAPGRLARPCSSRLSTLPVDVRGSSSMKLDVARDLVAGQVRLDVALDLVRLELGARRRTTTASAAGRTPRRRPRRPPPRRPPRGRRAGPRPRRGRRSPRPRRSCRRRGRR